MDDVFIDLGVHRDAAMHGRQPFTARSQSSGPPAQGAGWYESSWDLMRGLEVREGLPVDATPGEWLDVAVSSPSGIRAERSR